MKYVSADNLKYYDSKLKDYINSDELNKFAYGIEWDITNPSPKCTRIGNLELHRLLPIQSSMKGCLLRDDGTIAEYLPKDDWSNSTLDGSKGQVMVEIPEFYYKFETDGNKRRAWISTFNLTGFRKSRKGYVGAYEAALDRLNLKLSSVVNESELYRGGNNNVDWDGTYRSLLGKPATNINLNNFRTYARNRGSVSWNCYLYRLHKMIVWLYYIEYANFNCLLNYNSELTSDGFRQGGLGLGVTTFSSTSKWNNYNNLLPFVNCGVTNNIGNNTGVVNFDILDSNNEVFKTFFVPRYRGIENIFGHIQKFIDGCKTIVQSNTSGGLSKFYICDNLNLFDSTSNINNYNYIGNSHRKDGYIKSIIFGEDGDLVPLEHGTTSSTYFCDYVYFYIPTNNVDIYSIKIGGTASYGLNAGLASFVSSTAMSSIVLFCGSRLCYDPLT